MEENKRTLMRKKHKGQQNKQTKRKETMSSEKKNDKNEKYRVALPPPHK